MIFVSVVFRNKYYNVPDKKAKLKEVKNLESVLQKTIFLGGKTFFL